MDMHIGGKLVYIELKTQRYKCLDCNTVMTEEFDFIDNTTQMTTRMREDILKRCLTKTTFKAISTYYSISDKTVRRVFDEYVSRNERLLHYEAPDVLGIDEAHIDKHFRLIVTDIMNKRLLDMLENNSYNTVTRLLTNMPNRGRIKVVTMDFAPVYAKAVKDWLPDAVCVIDKFHVIQDINRKVDKVRISIHKQAKSEGKDIKRLKDERKLFMANLEDLSTANCQKLTDWFEEYPQLSEVYFVKEKFREIYAKAETKFEASQMFNKWLKEIPDEYEELKTLKRFFKQRKDDILNYFDYRQTNALTESLNNTIKEIEKIGHGYRFEVLRARALFYTKATVLPKFEPKKAFYEQSNYYAMIDVMPTLVSGFYVDLDKLMQCLND
jgi:transposase